MEIIKAKGLRRDFKVKIREKSFLEKFCSFFVPKYKTVCAVKNINFTVKVGERLAFIGPNGAGKSTTIKMLVGILRKSSGTLSVLGLDPQKERKKLAGMIGTVFGQHEQLWPNLTVRENLMFFGSVYGLKKDKAEKKINEFEELFLLHEFSENPVKNLSLGQKVRCEIAVSLIHSPKILFLDEPTIGLDPLVKENVRELIITMNREYGTTIFLTSHDIGDIESLCDRIIIIKHGEIVIDGATEGIKNYFGNESLEGIIADIYRDNQALKGNTNV
jgi:ABC-2 type transport system ATP-binding protein